MLKSIEKTLHLCNYCNYDILLKHLLVHNNNSSLIEHIIKMSIATVACSRKLLL